ncbi:unnamed protein product [Tilletia controversa]|uniref:WLM-domain-containing protein n=3 Tax=Tilletia TaxID=13289 RepID=A0A8X7MXC4_9BASI|nr:hypothetical protein CF336_g3379 [Tilletia laevis]KAE8203242.1 hypothetical protein CF328_g1761 [Tilletia controversa]KAE8254228.1 hypothetical protein A4X03_0g5750 [Tilletia caries]KAE8204653.1 hypothetical protein CF335_g2572 [Tilletia laevis]KAE8252805.1 hypothetical protein A4X06_0g1916 [Tilletia controversa]
MPVEGRGLYKKPPESHRFVESIATSGPSHSASAGPYIAEYRALNRKGSEQCLQILRRVGTLVKPLMVKHGWRLPLLAEFYPNEKNLLGINVNGGQKICLRLRAPHNPDQIWDEHVVMGCMLHELTHNVRGPHDSVFYAFLDKLKDEYQSIRISGWSGEGFLVPGRTLGRGMQQHVRQGMHTAVAAAMAEERRRRALLGLDSAPRRLGGASSSSTNMTPAQRATEAAATRRAQQDNAQCPCASAADLAQVERETNEREEREGVEIVEVRPGGREAEEDRAAADFLLQKVVWNADAGPSSIKQEVKLESTSGIKPQSASVSGKRPMSAINSPKGATQAEAITIADDSSGSSIEEGGDNLDDDIQLVATKIKRKPFQPPPPPDTRTPLQRSSEGAPSMKLLKPAMWKRLQAEADAAKSSAAAAARDKDTKAKARNQRPVAVASTSRGSGGVGVNVTGANVRSAEAAAGLALGLQAGWIGPHDLSQQASGPTRTPSSSSSSSAAAGWAGGASTEWTCQTCTLVNGALSEACVACSAPHPAILSQLFS